MSVIKHQSYYRRCRTQNHWRSVDTHFQDGVWSVLLVFFAIKAANTLFITILDLSHPQITQDTRPIIVDAPLTLILTMWYGACVNSFGWSRGPIHWKWTVMYQCEYFTIYSRIFKCDHKCETRHAEPVIGTDWFSQTQHNRQVDRYVSVFGPPRVCGSYFWTGLELDWHIFAVQIRTAGWLPAPIANTTHYTSVY